MATFAPSCAKRIATASPIPDEAPVIKAFFPKSFGIVLAFPPLLSMRGFAVPFSDSQNGILDCPTRARFSFSGRSKAEVRLRVHRCDLQLLSSLFQLPGHRPAFSSVLPTVCAIARLWAGEGPLRHAFRFLRQPSAPSYASAFCPSSEAGPFRRNLREARAEAAAARLI